MRQQARTRHRDREIDGLTVHYREAGDPSSTAVLLLHGSPSSSYSFRAVLPVLGERFYAVAPDLVGYGFSAAPPVEEFGYSFERLSQVVERLVDELGIERFVLFVTDFSTPVGYLLALRHPERVLGLVVQNGNTHEAGLKESWDTALRYWAEPTDENLAAMPEWLNFAGTRDTYLGGLPSRLHELHPRESWHLDWERLSRPGNLDVHLQLFHDYRHHVERFPEIAAYHREHQPPCLVLWGRHDPFFDLAELGAYDRELDRLEAHVYDAGHFLLETHADEVAGLLVTFVGDVVDGGYAVDGAGRGAVRR